MKAARFAGSLLVALLAILLLGSPTLADDSFSDVPTDNPYRLAIESLADHNIVSGFGNGTFGPEDLVKRQQFAKMIVLTMGLRPSFNDVCTFGDVPWGTGTSSDPLYPYHYVAVAAQTGLTQGYPEDNTFRPYNQITRQQVVTMVVRAAGTQLETPPADWVGALNYSDPTHGANIRKAEFNHLLDGLVGLSSKWNAYSNASRGECARLLYNLLVVKSAPAHEPSYRILQEGNAAPKFPLQSKRTQELADNRIGHIISNLWQTVPPYDSWIESDMSGFGAKRIRLSINEADANQVDWSKPELEVAPSYDDLITDIAAQGITLTYRLQFWDKAYLASGGEVAYPRFKTEDQILRYLDFVRFIVRHFKDRIQYYEIWNEPACENAQGIQVDDYINLVRRAVPVIKEEYPEAKIVVGSISGLEVPEIRAYLFRILASDVMPLADVVTWHPLFSSSPVFNTEYYYDYPGMLQQIKDTAFAHGFRGEYIAEELVYGSPDCSWGQPDNYLYSNIVAAKYYARGMMLHLGMDVSVGVADNSFVRQRSFTVMQNLCTIMAGAKPESLPIQVQSQGADIKSYGFSLPNGDKLVSLWTDGVAVDEDPGVKATVIISGTSPRRAIGMDILNNFEQQMLASVEGGNLVIRDIYVKDHPIILRLAE